MQIIHKQQAKGIPKPKPTFAATLRPASWSLSVRIGPGTGVLGFDGAAVVLATSTVAKLVEPVVATKVDVLLGLSVDRSKESPDAVVAVAVSMVV